MNLKKAIDTQNKINLFIENKEVKNAIDQIKQMAAELNLWDINNRIEEIETNYKFMIHYFVEGQNDPEQENVYKHIIRNIFNISDDLLDSILLKESSEIFYEKRRIANIQQKTSITEYINIFTRLSDSLSVTDLMPEGEDKDNRVRHIKREQEKTAQNIFYSTFISSRSNNGDINDFKLFFNSKQIPLSIKCMIVSALTLNQLERFDKRKIELILDLSNSDEPELAVRAIVGLIPILRKYKSRWVYYPQLISRIEVMQDDNIFVRRLMIAIIEFIQAHETEKISKKLNEEILPEMMKLSPMLGKKINPEEWLGESGLDDKNPEWQNILDESGLSDKLKEFSEMQLGGADIFHSTFSNLKNYPFFSEMSNWFIPFDKKHTTLEQMFSNKQDSNDILSTMLSSNMICNSDKYSFCFSIMQMPESYRKMVASQMGAESEELKRMSEEELVVDPNQNEKILFKQYVQDLYRFFKLYQRKKDFKDIFCTELDFHKISPINNIISEPKNIKQISLHYFEKNNFKEALEAFMILINIDSANSETWQKIGYCRQTLGDIKGALEAYRKAELIDENNSWLLRRIGSCYRMTKEPESALQYYKRLEQLRPDDLNVQLNIGHCFLELGQYEEALNYFFKVDFLSNENARAWRSIAWSSFLSRKFDTARKYYTQIIETNPNAQDYLNAGHVELCESNIRRAVELYVESTKMFNGYEKFITHFEEDMSELLEAGVDSNILPLVLDKIRYEL